MLNTKYLNFGEVNDRDYNAGINIAKKNRNEKIFILTLNGKVLGF